MGFHNRRFVGVAALVCAAVGVNAVAQSTRPQEPEVLPALLVEVRGLRHAMEQLASAGPRVQLALGRLQLQEQRLNTMLRRLEGVRDSLIGAERSSTEIQRQIVQMQEAVKSLEAAGREGDVRAVTFEVGELKRRLAASQEDVQRLQAEEGTLQQQIAGEQARWSDVNRTLEDLERALGKRGGV
jgi:predicted  nucleic acid-binding Zn-ribbon protein